MDRRTFLEVSAATAGWTLLPARGAVSGQEPSHPYDLFPPLPPPGHLQVAPLKAETLAEQLLFTCFQGLVNRTEPRIYYLRDEYDEIWLEFYRERYGIQSTRVDNAAAFLKKFAQEIEGYIVVDPAVPDSLNAALILGALQNAVPVFPEHVDSLKDAGLKEKENLSGRWKNRYEVYRWAIRELLPQANRRLLGVNCVDEPHWPSRSSFIYDYLTAHKVFTFDLSSCRRDREDLKLVREIYGHIDKPACLLGWRSPRYVEHEMVGLAARNGIAVLCGLSALNLSVHAAIPKASKSYQQKHLTVEEVGPVENKVYVAFMNTDGDSLASMLRLQSGRFLEAEHGSLPYSWGFLPACCDLMPGVAEYTYQLKQDNDYFVAPTCGALYTYPHLLPDTREYLRYTRKTMQQADLRAAYISDWDDDWWWQEMEVPGLLEALREELPESIGFFRGMGESAFEPQVLGGGAPYLFCGEGIHSDSDVFQTLAEFVAANTNRPLFVFCLVNHGTTLKRMVDAVHRLPKDEFRYVRLDTFIHLVTKAYKAGLVGEDFYPDKTGVKEILAREARAAWPKWVKNHREHTELAGLEEFAYRRDAKDPIKRLILDRTATPVNDIVAYDAVWDAMHLVRLSLNVRGIYVNNKQKGVKDFMTAFEGTPDLDVVRELWKVWEDWETRPIPFEEGCRLTKRLAALRIILEEKLEL